MTRRSSKELTWRQNKVYTFVRDYIAEHGYAPTIREIAEGANLASSSSVAYVLSCLETKGYISRISGRQAVAVAGQVMVSRKDLHELLNGLSEDEKHFLLVSENASYRRLCKAAGLS